MFGRWVSRKRTMKRRPAQVSNARQAASAGSPSRSPTVPFPIPREAAYLRLLDDLARPTSFTGLVPQTLVPQTLVPQTLVPAPIVLPEPTADEIAEFRAWKVAQSKSRKSPLLAYAEAEAATMEPIEPVPASKNIVRDSMLSQPSAVPDGPPARTAAAQLPRKSETSEPKKKKKKKG